MLILIYQRVLRLIQPRSVVLYQGKENPLTYRELQMLKILADKKAITYEELHTLWSDTPTDNAIRSFVKQLRKKLPDGIIKVRSKSWICRR